MADGPIDDSNSLLPTKAGSFDPSASSGQAFAQDLVTICDKANSLFFSLPVLGKGRQGFGFHGIGREFP